MKLPWRKNGNDVAGQEMQEQPRPPKPRPWLLDFRSAKWFIILTVCVAVFTDLFLYGLIVPVMPFAITERAGVRPDQVQQWVSILLAVYGAGLLVGSPVFGWIADHTKSRRSPLLAGLLALSGSTLLLCLGKTAGLLVLGRLLQGISASMVWTVGLALLVDTVGESNVGEIMGYVSISLTASMLAGPLLGGVVYERAGYYAVFAMAFGLLGFDILLRLVMIEKKIAARWDTSQQDNTPKASQLPVEQAPHLDGPAVERSESRSQKALPVADPQPVAQEASHQPEKTRPSRLVERLPPVVTLLQSRRLLSTLWCSFVQALIIASFEAVIPLFVNRVFRWGPTAAGLVFLADMAPTLSAPLVGWASDTYGPRWIATAGFVIALPPLVLLRLVEDNTIGHKALLVALIFVVGTGMTLVIVPVLAEMTYLVQARERRHPGGFGPNGAYAQAYGLFNMAFAGGTLVGPIWGGFIERSAGWGTMTWTLGLISVCSALPAAIFTGGFITRPDPPAKQRAKQEEEGARARADL